MEIKRDVYLHKLINARQNGFIKVITGPRRCGKSYLLTTLFHNHLLSEGVDENHIIEVELEDRANIELRNFSNPLSHWHTHEKLVIRGLSLDHLMLGVTLTRPCCH